MGTPVSKENEFLSNVWPDALDNLVIDIITGDKDDCDNDRVAGLGRLLAGAKMAMKPFVKHVFTIFATNASFLRVISNFRI